MELEKFSVKHAGIIVTARCNLRCKLCAVFCSKYTWEEAPHYTLERLSVIIERFFQVVDFVEEFSVTGGEPLVHENIEDFMDELAKYRGQYNSVALLTNGAVKMSERLVDILEKNKDKFRVVISHYGELSPYTESLQKELSEKGINVRVLDYGSDQPYCGGWVDFGNYQQVVSTEKELKEHIRECIYVQKAYMPMFDGVIYTCGRCFRANYLKLVEDNPKDYVDIMDMNDTVEELRKKIQEFRVCDTIGACALCNGLKEDSIRVAPAEQE